MKKKNIQSRDHFKAQLIGIILFILILFPSHHALQVDAAQKQKKIKKKRIPDTTLVDYCRANAGRNSYGLYLQGIKVGWFSEELKIIRWEGRDVALLEDKGLIGFTIRGFSQSLNFHSRTIYSLKGDGQLLYADKNTVDNNDKSICNARRNEKGYVFNLAYDKYKKKIVSRLSRDTLLSLVKMNDWLQGRRKPGDTITQYSFNFEKIENSVKIENESPDPDEKEVFTYAGIRKIQWGGLSIKVSKVKLRLGTLRLTIEMLPNGSALKFYIGPVEARLEEESVAKNMKLAVVDMFSYIPVRTHISDVRKFNRMLVELSRLGDFKVPTSARQKLVKKGTDSVVLDIQRDRRKTKPEKLSEKDRKRFTGDTLRVQSGHGEIRRLARKIAGRNSNPLNVVRRLQSWVFRNIKNSYASNTESAMVVLKNRAGDCTEHTLLFVALARSMGIPSREVGGLIYDNTGKPGFYWHAWAEIHDGKGWVSVDPSWNEVFVNATHIKMASYRTDAGWMHILGKLKIRILSLHR